LGWDGIAPTEPRPGIQTTFAQKRENFASRVVGGR
jgi:hypothetical protein